MPEINCPACDSSRLWEQDFAEDGYQATIYRHCYECGFCWDSKLEGSDELKTDSSEYASLTDSTNYC